MAVTGKTWEVFSKFADRRSNSWCLDFPLCTVCNERLVGEPRNQDVWVHLQVSRYRQYWGCNHANVGWRWDKVLFIPESYVWCRCHVPKGFPAQWFTEEMKAVLLRWAKRYGVKVEVAVLPNGLPARPVIVTLYQHRTSIFSKDLETCIP